MKVLLLHPDDVPHCGPWAKQKWDRIVDLGLAGSETYLRWSKQLGCEVETVGFAHADQSAVRENLSAARDYLLDGHGIDWWDVISIRYTQSLLLGTAIAKMAPTFDAGDELFVSRAGLHWRLLEAILRRRIFPFAKAPKAADRLFTTWRKVRRISFSQAKQVLADKYDPEYRVRRHISGRRKSSGHEVVLLPSAYGNVSRMALAYASTLPESQFLLVNARGRTSEPLPMNVRQTDLACYVESREVSKEHEDLSSRWKALLHHLRSNCLLAALADAGVLDSFESELRQWLGVREAWSRVYDSEQVTGVLCCDDSNPYTRLPLLLARRRGLPTYVSHHGALDGQTFFRNTAADVVLAKGAMERDYLVRHCGLRNDKVEIGAPIRCFGSKQSRGGSSIVFFSENYEVSGGRVDEFYRDVLPPLAEIAAKTNRRLVLKLHPAESFRERRHFVQRVLTRKQQETVEIMEGPLNDNFFHSMWFGVTVISTTAVECALRQIPVFLCQWLENWPYKYAEQFARFGVGFLLRQPSQIASIPAVLEAFPAGDPSDLWQAAPEGLLEVLSANGRSRFATAL